jgi:hypothetical protein
MTGVQALERPAPGLPLRPGKVERREFESIRHRTLSFVINFDVVTGQVICPSVGPLGGRLRADQLRVGRFECPKLLHQPVVLGVSQGRAVQHVVRVIRRLDLPPQASCPSGRRSPACAI